MSSSSPAEAATTALQPVLSAYTARLASLEAAQSGLIEKLQAVLAEASSIAASGPDGSAAAAESKPLLDASALRAYTTKVETLIRKQAAIRGALSDSQARLVRIEGVLAAHEKAHKAALPAVAAP